MEILKSLPTKTKEKIIIEIATLATHLGDKNVIKKGLRELIRNDEQKINEVLLAVIKTPTLDFDARTAKMLILTKYVGVDVATGKDMIKLLFVQPTKRDAAMLLAIVLLSSKSTNVVKKRVERMPDNKKI